MADTHRWSFFHLPPLPLLLSFGERRQAKRSEADSCCKSSHSRRAPGSPGLVCRTSNVTNHLGFGNTRLSSSPFFPLLSRHSVGLAVTTHAHTHTRSSCPTRPLNFVSPSREVAGLFCFAYRAPRAIAGVMMTQSEGLIRGEWEGNASPVFSPTSAAVAL